MKPVPRIRPSLLPRPSPSISQCQRRSLTSSSPLAAGGGNRSNGKLSSVIMKEMSHQQNVTARMRDLKRAEIPSDFGILPETFIKPGREDLPGFLSTQFRRRIRIEWLAIYQKAKDLLGLYYLSRWAGRKDPLTRKRRKSPMYLRDRPSIAIDLHTQLYKSLAAGDINTLRRIACDGLLRQSKVRLDQRRASGLPAQSWFVKYRGLTPSKRTPWLFQALTPPSFKAVQIIADRTAELPFGRNTSVRQVVVRIRSKQSIDNTGTREASEAEAKDLDECLVLQRMKFDGVEDEGWMVWGTTRPSTKEDIDRLLEVKPKGESVWARVKDRMSAMMSGGGSV